MFCWCTHFFWPRTAFNIRLLLLVRPASSTLLLLLHPIERAIHNRAAQIIALRHQMFLHTLSHHAAGISSDINTLHIFCLTHLQIHLSDILSDILSGTSSLDLPIYLAYLAYLLTFYLAYLLTFYLAYILTFFLAFYLAYLLTFYLTYLLTFFLAYLLTFCLAYLLTFFLAFYLAYLLTFYLTSFLTFFPLRSGSAHCDLEVAVEVRQCPLRSGARGGGPAVPTGIWRSAVEVRLCPLGSGLRGGGGGGGGGGGCGGGGGGEQLW